MAVKYTKTEIQLPAPSMHKNVRSDLREEIQKYYVGKVNSNIGMQYVHFKDGILKAHRHPSRRDLMVVYYDRLCNAYIEPNGSISVQPFDSVELTPEENTIIRLQCAKFVLQDREYFEHENKWFREEPWMAVDGKTPEEAVEILERLGW